MMCGRRLALVAASLTGALAGAAGTGARTAAPDLHRVGNKLLDRNTGDVVHLKGTCTPTKKLSSS